MNVAGYIGMNVVLQIGALWAVGRWFTTPPRNLLREMPVGRVAAWIAFQVSIWWCAWQVVHR